MKEPGCRTGTHGHTSRATRTDRPSASRDTLKHTGNASALNSTVCRGATEYMFSRDVSYRHNNILFWVCVCSEEIYGIFQSSIMSAKERQVSLTVSPLDPCVPCGPGSPLSPFSPCSPVGPIRPIRPEWPFSPLSPPSPRSPGKPGGPLKREREMVLQFYRLRKWVYSHINIALYANRSTQCGRYNLL